MDRARRHPESSWRYTLDIVATNSDLSRLDANFRERSLKSEVSTPVLGSGGPVATPADGEGLLIGLAISGAGEFFVSLLIRDQAQMAAAAALPTPPAAAAAEPAAPVAETEPSPAAT